jgi:methyl-accepting chemotaxis protein
VTTRDIAENVSQASLGLADMNSNVASSSSKAQEIGAQIGLVRDASSEMSLSSQAVQESAHDLSRLAESLTVLVAKFKV